ncbi:MAG: tRNA lysidine(34) synthetase TilS [Anaerolineae bacterium]|nr:tRNA lysidine(34) synthetase TilS [Anaerolineae bacterium]
MSLLRDFQHTLHTLDVTPGTPIILGVSGGVDSLVMLHLFAQSREGLGMQLHVLHVDHRIRGKEAQADARSVASTCKEWGVPCRIEEIDVPALAARRKIALEEAARLARYTALGMEATRLGASMVAVAHNADDQAETVLMHLLRGSGLGGLRGMLPVSPLSDYHLLEPLAAHVKLIRPLLGIPRADIEAYAAKQGLKPRFDRSNLDTTYFRNRMRHEIILMLETVNPNLRLMLGHTASVIAADYEIVIRQVDAAWQSVVLEETDEHVRLDLAKWRELPLALQRGTIRKAAFRLRASLRDVSYKPVEAAVEVARSGPTGAQSTLPDGLTLCVGYNTMTITAGRPPLPDWPLLPVDTEIAIKEPGEIDLPGSDWRFRLSTFDTRRSGPAWDALLADPWAAPLSVKTLDAPISLRTRHPGDRFRPQGAGGTKKIAEFMIDAKIPAPCRASLPLLVVGDQIAWVCGWRVDEQFVVGPKTKHVWLARFEKVE